MDQKTPAPEPVNTPPGGYEPPKIERVLTADDLVREVQYAGSVSTDAIDGVPG